MSISLTLEHRSSSQETGEAVGDRQVLPTGEGAIDTPEEANAVLRTFFNDRFIPGFSRMNATRRNEYGAVVEGVFRNYAWLRGLSRPETSTLATLPDLSPDAPRSLGRVPLLLVTDSIAFRNIRAPLSVRLNGQTFRIFTHGNQITFGAAPLANGALAPIEIDLEIQSDRPEGERGSHLGLIFHLRSQASLISGNFDTGTNELVFQLSGVRVGPDTHQVATGLQGGLSIQGENVDLSNLTIDATPPPLLLYLNTADGMFRLRLSSLPPPAPPSTPLANWQTDPREWLQLPPGFWAARSQALQAAPNAARISETLTRIPGLPSWLMTAIPAGAGDVIAYLPNTAGATPGPIELQGNLSTREGSEAFRENLMRQLVFVRQQPNPPPRSSDDGEPFAISRSQNPDGTLFILGYRNEEGRARPDSDAGTELLQALSVPQNDGAARARLERTATNGRIEMSDLIETFRRNRAYGEHVDGGTLRHLLDSYLNDEAQGGRGTHRRLGHRGMITLGGLAADPQIPSQGEGARPSGLNELIERREQGRMVYQVHEYIDDRFRAETGDGLDFQYRAVLDTTPERAAWVLDHRASLVDEWVAPGSNDLNPSDAGRYSTRQTMRYLDQSLHVQRDRYPVGDVIVMRHAASGNGHAWTQTIRLVPITAGGRTQTLMLFDEHRDLAGRDADLPYPRQVSPQGFTPFNLLRGLSSVIAESNIRDLASIRFGYIASNIARLAQNPNLSRDQLREGCLYTNSGTPSVTVRILDYLQVDRSQPQNPILIINNEDATAAAIANDLRNFLGIPPDRSETWLRPRPNPIPGQSGNLRFIPLRELWEASGLQASGATNGVPFEDFAALARQLLDPPVPLRGTTDHMTAKTQRFWSVLHQIKFAIAEGSRGNIVRPTGADMRVNFFLFNSPNFHAVATPGDTELDDTADSLVTAFVPTTRADDLVAGLAEAATRFELFHDWSSRFFGETQLVTDANAIENYDPTQIYAQTVLHAGPNNDLLYALSRPRETGLPDGELPAPSWRHAVVRGRTNNMMENFGLWLLPRIENAQHQRVGVLVGRYSLTNTTMRDTDATVQGLALSNLPPFLSDLFRRAAALRNVPDRIFNYTVGTTTRWSEIR